MTAFLSLKPTSSPPPPLSGPHVPPSNAYAATVLRNELDKVATSMEGSRNQTLFTAASILARLVNADALDAATVQDELLSAARRAGLHDFEISATIQSAFDSNEGVVKTLPERVEPTSRVTSIQESEKVAQISPERPKTGTLESRLLTPAGLRNLPEPSPLINNVLDQGTTALLYGKWGSGKSFIALDWACSVATGRFWQGRPTKQAKVLYIVAEGVAGFSSRVNAWQSAWGQVNEQWMYFLPVPVNLTTRDVDACAELVQREGYGLVIFDTLARCMVGADENASKDAGIVIDSMTHIMQATPDQRGVVLGVHHTGKDGKTLRGSSAFEAGVDTVYFTEMEGRAITLRRTKRKDGPESDLHTLRLTSIDGTDSCIIETLTEFNAFDSDGAAKLKELFDTMFSQTGASNVELRETAMEQGMSRSNYNKAREELLRTGWLKYTGTGSRVFFERVASNESTKE